MNPKNKDIVSFNISYHTSVYGKIIDTKFILPFDAQKGEQILVEVLASNPPKLHPNSLTLCWGEFDYKSSPRMVNFLEKVDSNWRNKIYIYTYPSNISVLNKKGRKNLIINQLSLNYNGL